MPGCMLGSPRDLPRPVCLSDTVAAPEDDEVDSKSFFSCREAKVLAQLWKLSWSTAELGFFFLRGKTVVALRS